MIPATRVAICITTFQRSSMLRALLHSIQELTFGKVLEPEITVFVVDNDPAGSARPVVAEFLSRRYRIRYEIECRRGVSYARNRAIAMARSADFIAFLDDDEVATPSWLDTLLTVQSAYAAAIVAGPVIPRFQSAPPAWLVKGLFFERRRHHTGTRLSSVGAGNVLLSAEVLHRMSPIWFDPRYSLTGGEDTHFFRRSAALGFPVVWADDAVVFESLPVSRLSPEYLVRRARSGANQWTRVDLDLTPGVTRVAWRFAVGMVRVAQGSALRIASPALSPEQKLRGELLFAEGVGNLQAFVGHSLASYGVAE